MAGGRNSRSVRFIVTAAICLAILTVVAAPTFHLASTSHTSGHHAGVKSRIPSPGGSRMATTTATQPALPTLGLAGYAPLFQEAWPGLVCSREPFVPPRA